MLTTITVVGAAAIAQAAWTGPTTVSNDGLGMTDNGTSLGNDGLLHQALYNGNGERNGLSLVAAGGHPDVIALHAPHRDGSAVTLNDGGDTAPLANDGTVFAWNNAAILTLVDHTGRVLGDEHYEGSALGALAQLADGDVVGCGLSRATKTGTEVVTSAAGKIIATVAVSPPARVDWDPNGQCQIAASAEGAAMLWSGDSTKDGYGELFMTRLSRGRFSPPLQLNPPDQAVNEPGGISIAPNGAVAASWVGGRVGHQTYAEMRWVFHGNGLGPIVQLGSGRVSVPHIAVVGNNNAQALVEGPVNARGTAANGLTAETVDAASKITGRTRLADFGLEGFANASNGAVAVVTVIRPEPGSATWLYATTWAAGHWGQTALVQKCEGTGAYTAGHLACPVSDQPAVSPSGRTAVAYDMILVNTPTVMAAFGPP